MKLLVECEPSKGHLINTLGGWTRAAVPEGVGPGGCGRFFVEAIESAGAYGRTSYVPPARCPHCNGWSLRSVGVLRARVGRGRCNAECRLSESLRCHCSCGGANHGQDRGALVKVVGGAA